MSTPLNPSAMYGAGSSLIIDGATVAVGYQGTALKAPSAVVGNGISLSGNTLIVSRAGAVLDGVDLRGYQIEVRADNVVIKNSLFNATGFHTIYQTGSATGLVVEYNTFDGQKANNSHSDYIYSDKGASTIRNNEFFNTPSDAVNTVGGLIEKNYFYGAGYQTGAHADAISTHLTFSPLTIRDNYIDWRTPTDAVIPDTNAAIKIVPVFGVINDVRVEGNVLLGGGYTIYAQNATYNSTNVTIADNEIGYGHWGQLYPASYPGNFSYFYNKDFSSGSNLTNIGSAPSNPPPTSPPPPPPPPVTPGTITGTDVQDFMTGTAGNETLIGNGGIDVVEAGAGNDTLVGGADRDWMSGEGGDDVYVYNSISDSKIGDDCDVIWGFSDGNDKIDLSKVDANSLVTGTQGFKFVGATAFSGQAGELRAFFDGTNTIVQGDVNGDKAVDFHIQVNGNNALTASSFIGVTAGPVSPPPAAAARDRSADRHRAAGFPEGHGRQRHDGRQRRHRRHRIRRGQRHPRRRRRSRLDDRRSGR